MKNTFNRFLCFVVIFGIFAFSGTFTSCENLFGGKAPINYEKAYITITTNLSTNARTVLPSNSFTEDTTGLTWTLTGSLNGGTEQQLKEWNDEITEESTTTAYNKMKSDTSITLNAGTWTFTLTASNESGKLLLEATIEQKINGGENTLDFDMKEAVGEGAASGQIEFTLTFPGNVIKNVNATLTKRGETNSLVAQTFTADQTGPTETFLSEVKFSYSGNDNEALSAGNYILKLELKQQIGTTEATENTPAEPNYEIINTYTCLIHVAPGLCSEGKAELETLAPLYTINYLEEDEKTEITSFEENSVPTTYNKYTTFALPTPTKDGHIFSGWYEKTDDDTFEKIENTDNFSISTNTNLYAKWNLIETWEDITRAVDCVPSTSLPSQPEFIVTNDLTATSTITVSREITLKALDGAGGVITRGEGFAGAFFDNTSTLTLEGITLDGGKDSQIEATAPLITSSGSLTLNNCTLQNNNNSNATETGTGIFLQINDTSSLCSFNDVSFGGDSSDEIPHIKIENGTSEKFTFNLGGSLEGGVPAIDMPSTTCINISESLTIPNGKSIKITLDEYTIGNRIISANEGINLSDEISKFSLMTDESWFIDSTGYLAKGALGVEPSESEGVYVVDSLDNLLWIARGLKTGSITSFNMILTDNIVIPRGEWQFYQLNVNNASTIDGQGHSITIEEDVSEFGNNAGGLFYKLNNSTVKNLVLKGRITAKTSITVNTTNDTTEVGYIGALCRSAYRTTIQNVMSTVEIIDEGSGNAGGLVGYFGGYSNIDEYQPGSFIQNCAVYANITSTNGTVGGLVGCTWENAQCWQINNCIYKGNVTGGTDQGVGAIIGTHKTGRDSTFKDTWYCANTSEIVGKYDNGTNGENFNGDDDTVISKTAEEIASAEAAALLGEDWEYVSGDYPTLKIVN